MEEPPGAGVAAVAGEPAGGEVAADAAQGGSQPTLSTARVEGAVVMEVEHPEDLMRASLSYLMGEHSLNAQVQMKQDEMTLYGKLEHLR